MWSAVYKLHIKRNPIPTPTKRKIGVSWIVMVQERTEVCHWREWEQGQVLNRVVSEVTL